ncbi:MAG: hypothetical protein IJZ06_06370 [Bacteroidales bacterium]|nr:hypothetical protein [Bacteroidales bacterium]
MKKSITKLCTVLLMFSAIILSSCNPRDKELEWHVIVTNDTNEELYVEPESDDTGFAVTIYPTYSYSMINQRIYRERNQDTPSEESIVHLLELWNIYRLVDGEKQYLPRNYYNSSSDFEMSITEERFWDNVNLIDYRLNVTEEMFEE